MMRGRGKGGVRRVRVLTICRSGLEKNQARRGLGRWIGEMELKRIGKWSRQDIDEKGVRGTK